MEKNNIILKNYTVLSKTSERVGAKDVLKATFHLEENTDSEYKQSVAVSVFGDEKVEAWKPVKIGDVLNVYINLRTTTHQETGRIYNNINAWKFEIIESNGIREEENDLPF